MEDEVVDPKVPVDDGDAVGHDIAAGGGEFPQVADNLGEAFDGPCIFRLCFMFLLSSEGSNANLSLRGVIRNALSPVGFVENCQGIHTPMSASGRGFAASGGREGCRHFYFGGEN